MPPRASGKKALCQYCEQPFGVQGIPGHERKCKEEHDAEVAAQERQRQFYEAANLGLLDTDLSRVLS